MNIYKINTWKKRKYKEEKINSIIFCYFQNNKKNL